MAKVSVHLVTWNSMRVLPEALDSLRAQTFTDFDLIVVDNGSNDGSVEYVRAHYPEATLIRNTRNLGFSRAHNQAVRMARRSGPEFMVVMNPDIILTPDWLARMVAGLEGLDTVASATGKVLKVLPREEEYGDPRLTDTIDSAGLRVKRDRRVLDRGSGEPDGPEFAGRAEVFGVSGALAVYRAEALDAAALGDEVFDEHFFAYKEDADLAWRLRLMGRGAAYVPDAVAYHYRGAGGREHAGFLEMLRARSGRSALVNRLSTRNHLLLLAKNEDVSNFLLHAPFILGYEFVKFLAVLVMSPKVLPGYVDFFRLWPKMAGKRRAVMEKRKVGASEIRKWFK